MRKQQISAEGQSAAYLTFLLQMAKVIRIRQVWELSPPRGASGDLTPEPWKVLGGVLEYRKGQQGKTGTIWIIVDFSK